MICYGPTNKKLGDAVLFILFTSFGVVVFGSSRTFSLIVILISTRRNEKLIITEETKLKKSISPAMLPLLLSIDIEPPVINLFTKVLHSLLIRVGFEHPDFNLVTGLFAEVALYEIV